MYMNKKVVIVEKEKKLLPFLQDFGFSYADACKILRNKDVKIDGKVQKDNIFLAEGQEVTFFYPGSMLEKKYEKIFEDDEVVVIYKFAGIESEGSLEESLHAKAVHRLDRNTEGLMVYAKTSESEQKLLKAFMENKVHKFYVAEVVGNFDVDQTFNAFLLKDAQKSEVKIFDKKRSGSVPISTKIKTLKSGNETSVLIIELLTGKTHQIRAHLAHLGHAIVGDGKYGKNENNKKFNEKRQKLACFCLKFDFLGIKSLDFQEFCKYPKWFVSVK